MTDAPQHHLTKPRPLARRGVAFVMILLLLVLVHALIRQIRESQQVTLGAEWIWIETEKEDRKRSSPQAFFAARDFDLSESPKDARLLILVDEEYRLSLNGRPVGGNRYRIGAALDAYSVADFLTKGTNRLWVDVNSMRGGGGLLVSLQVRGEDGAFEELISTDDRWKILRSARLGHRQGWLPLEPAEIPHVWGRPPIGRWGSLEVGPERPIPSPLARPIPREIRPTSVSADETRKAVWVFDWGRPVVGTLTLELAAGIHPWGEVQFAAELPAVWPEEPHATLLTQLGDTHWKDVSPRRFRYVRVLGLERLDGAFVRPIEEGSTLRAAVIGEPTVRPFGLEPPALRTPIGDYVDHVTRKQEEISPRPDP